MKKLCEAGEELNQRIQKGRELILSFQKPFLILVAIYLLGISAILRANFNYLDDMWRIETGSKGWENFSRYLSNFLSAFLHTDNYLMDISPLPQVIAILLLCASGIIVLSVITQKASFTLWELAAVIPLGLSPYFLECISYKYDSPYMALSVFASVFPLLFYRSNLILYVFTSMAGILVVCTTYQAASGIFPMLVILIAVRMWNNREENKKLGLFLMTSGLGYIIGMLVFRLFIMQPVDIYVSSSLPEISRMLPTIQKNLQKYFRFLTSDFKKEWLLLIIIIVVSCLWAAVRDTKRNRLSAFMVTGMGILLMLLCSFGVYPILSAPSFDPRAMYGFGAFLCFISVYAASSVGVYPGKLAGMALGWAFFVFAFIYGNALFVQSTYTDFRISSVIDDLKELEAMEGDREKVVQITGSIGYHSVIKNMPQDYQMLNRLLPINFQSSGWSWGRYGFDRYYGLKNIIWDSGMDLTGYDLPVIKDTIYHTIRGRENLILIELKE